MIDVNVFTSGLNWDSSDSSSFNSTGSYETDTRFYTLTKDKDGKGAALIRFLPDGDMKDNGQMGKIQKLFKINCNDRTTKRFVSEWSPSSIGQKDPFQEKFSELWNLGDKEGAKRYGRQIRYIANIKVINDKENPQNNGKIFLLDMSQTLADKIKNILEPSESDIALGVKPKQLFNPLNGYNFLLISAKGSNGIINYDNSKVAEELSSIYDSPQAAIDDITQNCHKLSDWLKPEAYKTYDELKRKMDWFDNVNTNDNVETLKPNSETVTNVTNVTSVSNVTTKSTESKGSDDFAPFDTQSNSNSAKVDDLDSMIAEMMK